MAKLSITGQMKVSTLQEGFLREFGLTLRIYDGRSFADPTETLARVRKTKDSGKALSVAKNIKVGNLEDKFEQEFGLVTSSAIASHLLRAHDKIKSKPAIRCVVTDDNRCVNDLRKEPVVLDADDNMVDDCSMSVSSSCASGSAPHAVLPPS